MKKTYFILPLVFVFTWILTLSCTEPENTVKQESLRQPELGEINFLQNTNFVESSKSETGKIVIIDIARKRHSPDPNVCGDCKCGLGICRACLFCERTNENSQKINILEENGIHFFELYLESPKIQGVDYNFYVDDDIYADDDSSFYIYKGIYTLDSSMGEHGGYKILVSK